MIPRVLSAALELVLLCSLPLLVSVSLVGLTVSLLQTVTGVQDQASSQASRLVTAAVTLILAAPWILGNLVGFTRTLWGDLGRFLQ